MGNSKRIGLQVLDDEVVSLINASAKIFPITQSEISNNQNPNGYEFVKLYVDADGKTYIYRWQTTQWSLIGADDKNVDWEEVKNKPISYLPTAHNHNVSEINDMPPVPTDTNQLNKSDVYTKTEVNTALANKASLTHDHDGRYAAKSLETTVTQLFTSANDGKTSIATAITNKGVSASPTDTYSALATKIGQITGASSSMSVSNVRGVIPSGGWSCLSLNFAQQATVK